MYWSADRKLAVSPGGGRMLFSSMERSKLMLARPSKVQNLTRQRPSRTASEPARMAWSHTYV